MELRSFEMDIAASIGACSIRDRLLFEPHPIIQSEAFPLRSGIASVTSDVADVKDSVPVELDHLRRPGRKVRGWFAGQAAVSASFPPINSHHTQTLTPRIRAIGENGRCK
mmetsp:Transcript_40411/g.104788  ORF Transcript_40411/g.104788 Transcript_40411/m.104788 type:complete len:110 (+) Transcript_40411:561-890(+)